MQCACTLSLEETSGGPYLYTLTMRAKENTASFGAGDAVNLKTINNVFKSGQKL